MSAIVRPLVLLLALTAGPALHAQLPALTEADRAAHVLNRLAFGPRPGEIERVTRMGVNRWIDQQLRPATMIDSAGMAALSRCPEWTRPAVAALSYPQLTMAESRRKLDSLRERMASRGMASSSMTLPVIPAGLMIADTTTRLMVSVSNPLFGIVTRDSASRAGFLGKYFLSAGQFFACRLARVETSEQQLVEVLTDFWGNHFSLHIAKILGRESYVGWDRDVIRPNVLGRFRDLLGAVAHHPAMLNYLDNAANSADSLNENYARELLELHTMGVDGGYTQADVISVARAFTGWTDTGPAAGGGFVPRRPDLPTTLVFQFRRDKHDTLGKTVLGRALPAARGIEDGEEVLDILARHPATARHIARKLIVRFVNDSPPPALVDRAAATYLRTGGDIREILRTIVTSREFFAPANVRAKFKTPHELVLSTRRALNAPLDTDAEAIDLLVELGQPPLGHLTPDGWPETAAPWLGAGASLQRIGLAERVANGSLPSIPIERWTEWSRLAPLSFDAQVAGVVRALLGGRVSDNTRTTMLSARSAAGTAIGGEQTLRELVRLALASPEFQRR
jgi:hypothetical protein